MALTQTEIDNFILRSKEKISEWGSVVAEKTIEGDDYSDEMSYTKDLNDFIESLSSEYQNWSATDLDVFVSYYEEKYDLTGITVVYTNPFYNVVQGVPQASIIASLFSGSGTTFSTNRYDLGGNLTKDAIIVANGDDFGVIDNTHIGSTSSIFMVGSSNPLGFTGNNVLGFYNETSGGLISQVVVHRNGSGISLTDGGNGGSGVLNQISMNQALGTSIKGNGKTITLSLISSGILVEDSTDSVGFVYSGDFSAANAANDRWLTDKGYVDGLVASHTSDNTIHFTQAEISITESQISDLSHFSPTSLLVDYGFTDNSVNWNTAFGWGDHALSGYLTSVDIADINATGTPSASNFLRGDGSWQPVSLSPAGSDTQVQYNNAGAFGASSSFTYDGSILRIGVSGNSSGIRTDGFFTSQSGKGIQTGQQLAGILGSGYANSLYAYDSDATRETLSIQSVSGTDTGTSPSIIISARASGSVLSNRPTLAGYNNTTKQWEVGADGTWDYQGNNIVNVDNFVVGASSVTNLGTNNGFLSVGNNVTMAATNGSYLLNVGTFNEFGTTSFNAIVASNSCELKTTNTEGYSIIASSQHSDITGSGRHHTILGSYLSVISGAGDRNSIFGSSSSTISAGESNLVLGSISSDISSTGDHNTLIACESSDITSGDNIVALGLTSETLTSTYSNHTVVDNLAILTAPTSAGGSDKFLRIDSNGIIKSSDLTPSSLGAVVNAGNSGSNTSTNIEVFDIGDWNMDTTDSVTVELTGVSNHSKIRSVSVLILDDNAFDEPRDLRNPVDESVEGYVRYTGAGVGTVITLYRVAAGHFDSTDYDSTSYNRGYVTVTYEDT